jgi:hypothetical protein
MHSITVMCYAKMWAKQFRRKTWRTIRDHPTAWQRVATYGKFDDGIGNNGLGNHEPPSLQP